MSGREFAKSLIDRIPESKMMYIIAYLQGAALPDETPNAETRAAIEEVDGMIAAGKGEHFAGSTADFFAQLNNKPLNLSRIG